MSLTPTTLAQKVLNLSLASISPKKPCLTLTLYSSCVVASAVTLEIKTLVKEAQQTLPDPGKRPPNRLFVPDSVRSQVLRWVHNSRFACHLGIGQTLSLLKWHFWWPTMDSDTHAYVSVYTVYAHGKASHQLPARLLRPLPFQVILGVTWH